MTPWHSAATTSTSVASLAQGAPGVRSASFSSILTTEDLAPRLTATDASDLPSGHLLERVVEKAKRILSMRQGRTS